MSNGEKTFEELLADMANYSAQAESESVMGSSYLDPVKEEKEEESAYDLTSDAVSSSDFSLPSLPELEPIAAVELERGDEFIAEPSGAEWSETALVSEENLASEVGSSALDLELSGKDDLVEGEPLEVEIPIYNENTFADNSEQDIDPYEEKLVQPKGESADEVVVTPDGHTLEDMLIHLRGGRTKIDKELADYKSGLKEVEVNGVKKKDNRYVKHAQKTESISKSNAGRKKSSKSFVQRNTRYTEEEKIIMKNLGLTPDGLVNVMKKDNGLTERDKARIISAGQLGDERHFKGKRFRATVGDRDIIQFLAKFKFSNTRILSRLRAEPQSRTWRKLQRLKSGGVVADSEVIGLGTIWYLTEAGMAFSGYSFPTYRNTPGKTSQMPPIIGANHVAACLWNNEHNILFLEDFPANNRLIPQRGEMERVKGETLISETELRSSLGRETNPSFGGVRDGAGQGQYAMVSESAAAIWHEWNSNGRSKFSPEFEVGNEYLWVLYPRSGLTKSFHIPDLIVSRPRDEDGTPRSIAVEVELNQKSYERYMETLMAYKLDEDIYEKVVWVTPSASISRVLSEIAETIGLEGFDVVPMSNEDGLYRNPDIWHI